MSTSFRDPGAFICLTDVICISKVQFVLHAGLLETLGADSRLTSTSVKSFDDGVRKLFGAGSALSSRSKVRGDSFSQEKVAPFSIHFTD